MPRETKAEKAERIERLHKRLHALKWPNYAKPQPMPVSDIMALCKATPHGYLRVYFQNRHTMEVKAGWTSSTLHCRDWPEALPKNWREEQNRHSVSRDAGECYLTLEDAARAMRWEVTEEAAEECRKADEVLANLGVK